MSGKARQVFREPTSKHAEEQPSPVIIASRTGQGLPCQTPYERMRERVAVRVIDNAVQVISTVDDNKS
ncbi:hypothetical protein PC128_g7675 [Phytophthora cactorum]|nr:hypothetical protein PC120_g5488 [Phytophthora cactorum]KAG3196402.1 hypothetical protein PC128_g7675 [Phytophthora cactorum]KAG4058292.1 hypothetical protein PC123_g6756 [Phytophthora cactorum]